MLNLILRILIAQGVYIFAFYQLSPFLPVANIWVDILALVIVIILQVALVLWDWNKGRKFSEVIAGNLWLIAYSVFSCWLLQLHLLSPGGTITIFVILSLVSPLTIVLLDLYNGYNFKIIIKRTLAGIVVNVGLISLFGSSHGEAMMLVIIAPAISAIISEFVSRKNKPALNLFFVLIFFLLTFVIVQVLFQLRR
jgi:hypothetical protein